MAVLLFLMVLSGCMQWSVSQPPGPWHEAYLPITDSDSHVFIAQSLEMAVAEFGEPVIPVNTVLLRRSKKNNNARHYRIAEDFSLTECVDPTNGVFVIYIGVAPEHPNYYALLGHECAHLLNAHITDWYMEGLATVFSEQVCAELGKEWGRWRRHFTRSRRAPYALSYRMMLELQEAFPSEYSQFVSQTDVRGGDSIWKCIDIDQWIQTLPEGHREMALSIIEPYAKTLRKKVSAQYAFRVPQPL